MSRYFLSLHGTNFSADELVINPESFPDARPGDLLELYHPGSTTNHLVLQVPRGDDVKGNLQLSIQRSVAQLFNFHSRQEVVAVKVDPDQVGVDHVELSFKDQYHSRSVM
jgi:hypothetical protein